MAIPVQTQNGHFDVALHQLNCSATWFLNAHFKASRQLRSSHFSATPVQTFKARDGWIFIMCMTDKFWTSPVLTTGREELLDDSRFATMESRTAHHGEHTELLDSVFVCESMEHWVNLLGTIVPIAPVFEIGQALASPFVKEVGMVAYVPHPQMLQ